jgi:hypothetical protein
MTASFDGSRHRSSGAPREPHSVVGYCTWPKAPATTTAPVLLTGADMDPAGVQADTLFKANNDLETLRETIKAIGNGELE